MTEYTFKVDLSGIFHLDCFKEATAEELKVLLTIKALEGEALSAEALSELLGISKARVKAAITLFEECGVLKSEEGFLAEVEYEFEPAQDKGTGAKQIARSIREYDLYEMNREMERILEKTLETREIERITSLHTKKGLSPEFILTLASHLKTRRQNLSVEYIVRETGKLIAKEIDTLEELEIYIKEKEAEVAGEMEMRRLFGIYGRTLTATERGYFKKWMHEYSFGSPIIGEAYDITVNAIGKMSFPYINTILTGWHDAGCKTLEECRARINIKKQSNTKKANNSSQKSKKSVEAETPKYADFNSEDALMRALERSYGEDGGRDD